MLSLPHSSVAVQVRVKTPVLPHRSVIGPSAKVTVVLPQLSVAVAVPVPAGQI